MGTHDHYDQQLLKAIQSIAASLRSIDSKLSDKNRDNYFERREEDLEDKIFKHAMEETNEN